MKNEDAKTLSLLAMFHYIVGGIMALFSCMPLIHVTMGIAMVTGNFFGETGEMPPPFFGWMFVIMGSVFVIGGWLTALAIILAGRKLSRHESRTFCMVVAGVECMFMPFGTVLGVFTLITLTKESVQALFDKNAPEA